jgi:hypothetical protein
VGQEDVVQEIKCLSILIEPLLNVFQNPKLSIIEQLAGLAKTSFMLLHIYRKFRGKFITKDLYMDTQCTIQDAFVCAYKFFKHDPRAKLLLFLLGTDPLEGRFGDIRTQIHGLNCDCLELKHRFNISINMCKIYRMFLSLINNLSLFVT